MRLWETEHDYYVDLDYIGQRLLTYNSWDAADEEWEFDNPDPLNWIIRWDWETDEDTNTLKIFIFNQRKCQIQGLSIPVERDEEPKIKDALWKWWVYMKNMWKGISD